MLAGVKIISRDQIDEVEDDNLAKNKKKLSCEKERRKKKRKNLDYGSSDDDLEMLKKGSQKKKWYSSDESSPSNSSESESEDSFDDDGRKHHGKKLGKKKKNANSRSKKNSKRHYPIEEFSSSSSEAQHHKRSWKDRRKSDGERRGENDVAKNLSDDGRESPALNMEIVRKEIGLEWMLRPADRTDKGPTITAGMKSEDMMLEEPSTEEIKKVNPKELNPYLKENGTGYPEEEDERKRGGDQFLSSSLVGDGGASWRMKSLKRAKEQADREGRRLEEVVEERWGSLGQLAASAASHVAAPSRAHLHAIKNRKKGRTEEHGRVQDKGSEQHTEKDSGRDYLRDVTLRPPEMRAPKVGDSLSWGKRRSPSMSTKDAGLLSTAAARLNKFFNDGSFMHEMLHKQSNEHGSFIHAQKNIEGNTEHETTSLETNKPDEVTPVAKEEGLTTNQLAAKALQLRMKGKHEEAQKLLQEVEVMKVKQGVGKNSIGLQSVKSTSRYVIQDKSVRKRDDDDADKNLARKIMQNKQYSVSGQADDEYDYEDGPSRMSRKKGGGQGHRDAEKDIRPKRILTQQERCQFCFENPNRPKHLVVSIANFTYLMLPQWEPVVAGHCCILPMQHEAATRTIDDNIWDEIRNFKKCLIMMFAKQEKEVVFLETVMGLAQQRRHCLIECIPLPQEIAKEAPLYFKKAIDEAEDEWSQHNAKKLIDTSQRGLRRSIPKDFPYFHVEFGLNRGFVHVIDDEKQFKSSFGLNVIRGMLGIREEDMYRRRRYESMELQKQAVSTFARDWEAFDWTKQLD